MRPSGRESWRADKPSGWRRIRSELLQSKALFVRIRSLPKTLFVRFRPAVFLIVTLGLAAACNRPAEEPPANVLATSVSSTLTAEPVEEATSVATATPIAVDQMTPEPSSTPGEKGIDGTPTPTVELTDEPEFSPTPSNTPIPLEPGDPRSGLNLSDPDYIDDFSERFTWFEFSDPESATVVWDDGRLRVTDHVTDGILWWTTTAVVGEDTYAEIIAQTSSCSGKDAYGMGIRVGGDNIDRGYTLEISCDGAWRMRKFIAFDEIPAVLRDWTESDLINTGPDATNQIGFLADGDQLHAFINGVLLDPIAIEDSDYSSGVPSLFTNASQTTDLTVHFDDFRLWFLTP